ncbi:unnamed protein product, partial [Prorocentrum cordatum]
PFWLRPFLPSTSTDRLLPPTPEQMAVCADPPPPRGATWAAEGCADAPPMLGAQQPGPRRKSVTFDTAPECFAPCAATTRAEGELAQESDSDVSMVSSVASRVQLGAPEDFQDSAASTTSSMCGDSDVHVGSEQLEDAVELAEIEAFADDQAQRFIPLIDKRHARRTATTSVGRTKQVSSINFQMKTSALWQRRAVTESGPDAPSRVHCAVRGAAR